MKRGKIQLLVVLATVLVFAGSINLFFSSHLGQTSVISDFHSQKKHFTPVILDSTTKVSIDRKVPDDVKLHSNASADNANANGHGNVKLTRFSKAPTLKHNNITNALHRRVYEKKVSLYTSAKAKGNLKHTGKLQSSETELKDIFISVKTGKNFHNDRIHLLLQTWMSDVIEQTYIISDGFDQKLHDLFGERFVNTSCGTGHARSSLCCKMSAEFDHFMLSKKKWFCHVDDDVYVHVGQLVGLLGRYDVTRPWYLGRVSINEPMRVVDPDRPGGFVSFNFGTGGAGVCLSRELARRMTAFAGGGRLMRVCDKIRLPDDCVIGYIVEHLVGVRLTEVSQLHSHLESMKILSEQNIRDAITLSYSVGVEGPDNMVSLPPAFPPAQDPTRLKTVHCFLFPTASLCRQASETQNSNKP